MAYRDREKSDITIPGLEAGDYVTVPLVFKFLPCSTCDKCSSTGAVERKPARTLIDWNSGIKGAYLKAVARVKESSVYVDARWRPQQTPTFLQLLEEACASKELAHTSNDELKSQLIAAEVIVEGLSEKYRYMKQYTHESLPEQIIANAHRALRELTAAIKGAVVDVVLGRTVYCDEEETV